MTKRYELTYLITPDLTEEEIKNLIDKISGFILKLSGTIEKTTGPERRKLAYLVKNKKDAFLASLIFSLSQDKIKEFFKIIEKENSILRYIIIILKNKDKEGLRRKKRVKPEDKPTKEILREDKDKKVEIEKIDEKIDEILK